MKVCAFGECLIDFTPQGTSEKGNLIYEQNPGGAPANLAVAIARQSAESLFIGKVGNDMFGDFLIETLKENRVDTSGIVQSHRYHTSLAFVQLHKNGERDFTFYRDPGADVAIESREINFEALNSCSIFHFGSVSMTHNPARQTTFELLEYARRRKMLITYDPNLRQPLWNSLEEAKEEIRRGLSFCDVLKVTEEELQFITEMSDAYQAAEYLRKDYGIDLILVTQGEKGGLCLAKDQWLRFESFKVEAIDSTGAGDAFFGCFLGSLCQYEDLKQLNLDDLIKMLRRASAAGALATTIKGAIPSLPDVERVESFLKERADEGRCYSINEAV